MILAVGILTLTGCNNLLADRPASADTGGDTGSFGRFTITTGEETNARTLVPASLTFTKYVVSFSSGPETKADVTFQPLDPKTVTLATGSWTITLTAYTGTGAAEKAAARGSKAVTIAAGDNGAHAITLKPYGETGATGTFTYSVTLTSPATIDSSELTISAVNTATSLHTVDVTTAADRIGSKQLDAGQYLLNIWVKKDGNQTGRTEVLHIYPGLTTAASYTFSNADIYRAASASAANVTLSGTAGTAGVTGDVVITLTNETFADAILEDDDVTPWFTGLPAGLTAEAKTDAAAGSSSITIAITGTPGSSSAAPLSISIPATVLITSTAALAVTANPAAKFAILPKAPTVSTNPTGDGFIDHNYYAVVKAGAYVGPDVTLTAAEGAIRYTLDGMTPTASSTLYSGVFTVKPFPADTTLNAVAITTDGLVSAPLTQLFRLKHPIATPAGTIDYENETITGLVAGKYHYIYHDYTGNYLTGTKSSAGTAPGGIVNIGSQNIKATPNTIALTRAGESPTTPPTRDSEPQYFTLPARPAAPAVGDVAATVAGNDGQITSTTTAMEYKLSSAAAWTDCTGTSITGLTAGSSYFVRYKAVTTTGSEAFASAQASVEIQAATVTPYGIWIDGNPTKISAAETFDDALTYFKTNAAHIARVNAGPETDYTLKLKAGTDGNSISAQTRLWGGTAHDTTSDTVFYTDSTLTIEGPDSGTAAINMTAAAAYLYPQNITLKLKNNITIEYTIATTNTEALIAVGTGATLEMNDTVLITGNKHTNTAMGGSGVRVAGSGTFNMKGGEISGNAAGRRGGGVAVYDNGTFNMSGGKIVGNSMYTQNQANGGASGGGVSLFSRAKFVKTGGIINGSTADGDGAANTVDTNGTPAGTFATNTGLSGNNAGAAVFVNNTATSYKDSSGNTSSHTTAFPRQNGKVTGNISYDGLDTTTGTTSHFPGNAVLTGTWE